MSQNTILLSELEGNGRISAGVLAYIGERARTRFYDYVVKKFRRSGITKADLARRIGKGPDRVNRLLASPGNWTIDTVAELLAGIGAEELLPGSAPFVGRPDRNATQSDLIATLHRPTLQDVAIRNAQSKGSFTASSASSFHMSLS